MKKDTVISIIATAILAVLLGYFIFSDLRNSDDTKAREGNMSTTTSEEITGDVQNENILSDEVVGELPKAPIPSLEREFVIPDGIYSDEIVENTMAQYNELVSVLNQNPELRDEWLQLALLYKAVEDYEGTEEVWIYVSRVWLLDHVAYGNLGDLYMNYLEDFSKAEEYLISALDRKSDSPQYVDNLYILYRFKQNDPDKALDLLLQGVNQLPNEIYFTIRAAEHYRDTEDFGNAKMFFERVVVLAKEQGLREFEKYANDELAKLK